MSLCRCVAASSYVPFPQHTHNVQAVSCDEVFVDATDICHDDINDVTSFAEQLRAEIFAYVEIK